MTSETTTRRCDNCGQPVLPADTTCWHCGTQLELPEPHPVAADNAQEAEPIPAMQIAFYAAMTVLTAILLLLVIRSLGLQPRLSSGVNEIAKVTLFAGDDSFRIDIPADWTWYFPNENQGRGDGAADMVGDARFIAGLEPLLSLAGDSELILLAQSGPAQLSVANSRGLGGLSVEEILASTGGDTFDKSPVIDANKGTNEEGEEAVYIVLEQQDPSLICQQGFLPHSEGAFLASACTTPEQYAEQAASFVSILASLTTQ